MAIALDVFFYVVVVPCLFLYAVLCIGLLISPAVFAFCGNAPLSERIGVGVLFCILIAITALYVLL